MFLTNDQMYDGQWPSCGCDLAIEGGSASAPLSGGTAIAVDAALRAGDGSGVFACWMALQMYCWQPMWRGSSGGTSHLAAGVAPRTGDASGVLACLMAFQMYSWQPMWRGSLATAMKPPGRQAAASSGGVEGV